MVRGIPLHYVLVRLCATVLIGIIAGIGGVLLTLLLHSTQHFAFGYSLDAIISHESFLQGVTDASGGRKVAVLAFGGVVASLGWWLLRRYGKPRVTIAAAVDSTANKMPLLTTLSNALLQVITVALGSPLGREGAPREVGALAAGIVARRLRLYDKDIQQLIACGAGAGLAAAYNIPLTGALFTLEVILINSRNKPVLMALITSFTASWVASTALGNEPQYSFSSTTVDSHLIIWAILSAPFLGAVATLFYRLTLWARSRVTNRWPTPLICLMAFVLIGVLSIGFPQLPGNGKDLLQLALDGELTLLLASMLLIFKLIIILAVLLGGAEGGLLTPGLAIGALLSVLLFLPWQIFFPTADAGSYALTGAAGFLAAAMRMPFTAIILITEFTRMDHSYLLPVALCVAVSSVTSRWLAVHHKYS